MLLWVNTIAYAFLERQWCLLFFPKKAEVPSVSESFHTGASGSPTACHEDFGADEMSKSCSHLRAQSVFSFFHSFEESEAQGTVCVESSTALQFRPSLKSCQYSK